MKCFGIHIICLSYSFYFSLFMVLGKCTRATISMPTIKLMQSANFSLFNKVEKKELSSILKLASTFLSFRGVIKHQVNLDTHFPGCNSMKINGSTIGDTGNVTWCSQKPIFEADKPEVLSIQ